MTARRPTKAPAGGVPTPAKKAPPAPFQAQPLRPRTPGQQALMEAIGRGGVVVALGPAGSGKTFLSVAMAVEALEAGRVRRIVLSRPAVEAGERLGFLPGELGDKMAPYMRPLWDVLVERLSARRAQELLRDGTIEIAPIGFMRGRTLNDSFVVVDESQNCTYVQLKMLLTRFGWGSTMVLSGDPCQSDLLGGLSGLGGVADALGAATGVPVVRLGDADIVRHPLVAEMLRAL